jgi:hypothetical protein
MESKSGPRVSYRRRNTENEIELSSLNNAPSEDRSYEYHSQPQYTYQPVPQPVYNSVTPSDNIKSTKWLKIKTLVASALAVLLTSVAITQSHMHYIPLGNSYTETVNRKASAIGAIVAIYAAIVTIIVRYCVSNVMILLTVYSLNTKGRYLLKARTWAYMITGKGPLYTAVPLFFAGLTATAIVGMLPVYYRGSNHSVNRSIISNTSELTSCWVNDVVYPSPYCTGLQSASSVMYAYTNFGDPYTSTRSLTVPIGSVIGSNESLGYPVDLVFNRVAEGLKYDSNLDRFSRDTPRTACVWTLADTPLSCTPLNTTLSNNKYFMTSPYTGNIYNVSSLTHQGQDGLVQDTVKGIELIMFQEFTVGPGGPLADGFICITKSPDDIYIPSTLNYQFTDLDTPLYVNAYPNSSCEPTYSVHSADETYTIIAELLAGIFGFSTVSGSNVLIDSFSTAISCPTIEDSDCIALQFWTATSTLENGIGSLYASIASQAYTASKYEVDSDISTTVYGGPIRVTVGLEKYSPLQTWYIIVLVPIITFVVSLFCPVAYLPDWDIINPVETLVAEAYIDQTVTTPKDRTVAVRLSKLNGKIVATNRTDLPHIAE